VLYLRGSRATPEIILIIVANFVFCAARIMEVVKLYCGEERGKQSGMCDTKSTS
jgi:hypothetical protein